MNLSKEFQTSEDAAIHAAARKIIIARDFPKNAKHDVPAIIVVAIVAAISYAVIFGLDGKWDIAIQLGIFMAAMIIFGVTGMFYLMHVEARKSKYDWAEKYRKTD